MNELRQLFAPIVVPAMERIERYWLARQLATIDNHLAVIRKQRQNDYLAESELHKQSAFFRSRLRPLEYKWIETKLKG